MTRLLGDAASLPQSDCAVLAWITFIGSGATPKIQDGYNHSSITDSGNGLWAVTWSQAISAGTDYAVTGIARVQGTTTGLSLTLREGTYLTTTSVSLRSTLLSGTTATDGDYISVIAVGAP